MTRSLRPITGFAVGEDRGSPPALSGRPGEGNKRTWLFGFEILLFFSSRSKILGERMPCGGFFILRDLFRCSNGDDFASGGTTFGSEVNNPVGGLNKIEVVLDNDDRVAAFDEALQNFVGASRYRESANPSSARRERTTFCPSSGDSILSKV